MLTKKVTFGFFVLGLFFLECGLNLSQLLPEQTMDPLPPTINSRTISQDLEERLVWRKNQINIRRTPFPSSGLLVGYSYVAFINFTGGPLSMINQLNVLETNTGAPFWQSEHFGDLEDIVISKDRALVLLNRGSPLNVYNIRGDSQPLFSVNYPEKATKFYLFPMKGEENIHLYYQQGEAFSIHTIDLTGKEGAAPRSLQASASLSRLFLFDKPFFLLAGQEYVGGSFETGEELWRIPAPGRVDSWPVLQGDRLIISTGDGKRYTLTAIDVKDGRQLWGTEKIFGSNVVFHQDNLYALRNDAVLVELDFITGQIKAEMPFNPSSIDAGQSAYWLASDGVRLFVYFGDSQELFALKIS